MKVVDQRAYTPIGAKKSRVHPVLAKDPLRG